MTPLRLAESPPGVPRREPAALLWERIVPFPAEHLNVPS